jgi:hypothetical protein
MTLQLWGDSGASAELDPLRLGNENFAGKCANQEIQVEPN